MPQGVHLERQCNVRLPEETHALLFDLTRKLRITKTEILTRAIRQFYGNAGNVNGAIIRYRAEQNTDDEDEPFE